MNYPGGQGYLRGSNNSQCSPYGSGSPFTSNRPNLSPTLYQCNDCTVYEGHNGGNYNAQPTIRAMTNGSTVTFPSPWSLHQQAAQLQNMPQYISQQQQPHHQQPQLQQQQQQQQQPAPMNWNDFPQMKESTSIGCMPAYPPSGHPTPGSPSSYNSMNRREHLQQPIYPTAEEFSAYYSIQGSAGGR